MFEKEVKKGLVFLDCQRDKYRKTDQLINIYEYVEHCVLVALMYDTKFNTQLTPRDLKMQDARLNGLQMYNMSTYFIVLHIS